MGRVKLYIKGLVLLASLVLAYSRPDGFVRFFTWDIVFLKVYHLFWLTAVLVLIKRMIPRFNAKTTSGKIFRKLYRERGATGQREEKLAGYVRKMNRGALRTAVYWTLVILAVGEFYFLGLIGSIGLYMIVLFFIFMDQFCVSVWCPFQAMIRNKCCNTCRINNWGYLMAFAPLVYLPSFWTYSVLALSALVVIQWEYLFRSHPERFYEFYNMTLMCKNCETKCSTRFAVHGSQEE